VNVNYESSQERTISAGFSALTITPNIEDEWTDVNGDAQYKVKDGDHFEDKNGNGQFDPVWLAGFQNQRPAQGVHDDLWARTMVLSDGRFTLSFTMLDLIGLGSDDIISIRKKVQEQVPIDYCIIASTHTHEGPDVIGLWGANERSSGVNQDYMQSLIEKTSQSIIEAYKKKEPAVIQFGQDKSGALHLVEDSRPPIIMDHAIRVMHVLAKDDRSTLGTLINWANHPETTWNKNLQITSDFPHYIREGMENGVVVHDTLVQEGLGGICIFANGSIGGLMTTSPDFGIPDLQTGDMIYSPSFEKAEAQGYAIAIMALNALEASTDEISTGLLNLRAKSFKMPMTNRLYKLALLMGVLDKGMFDWWELRTEVAYWNIGPAEFIHHPAEIYPEIIIGGIEEPEGRDYDTIAIETPPIQSFLKEKYQFHIGLSNDMIGYVIPKSQWDAKAPFTYDYEEAPYGEINSLGPKTAPILYEALAEIVQ